MSSTNGSREVLEAARKRLASAKSQRSVASNNLKMQQQMLDNAKSMSEAADKEYTEARKALEDAEKKYEVIDIDNDNKGSRKRWHYHVEFASDPEDSVSVSDSEDSEVDDIHSLSCPITGMIFTNPVKNEVCHHNYDRAGLSQLLGARKTSCPIPGCGNKNLSNTQVEDDEHMKVRVERYLIRKAAEKMKYRS